MAKSAIGMGKFSGKLGGFVYAIRNGNQIIREKPLVVANPKTSAQLLQRAKANLVGQLSKIVPRGAIVGLGHNAVERRSRFLKIALNVATATIDEMNPSNFVAKIQPQNIVFSEGSVNPAHYISNPTLTQDSIVFPVAPLGGLGDDILNSTGLMLVVVIADINGTYNEVKYRVLAPEDIKTSKSVTISHSYTGAYSAFGYVVPFSTLDGSSLTTIAGRIIGTVNDLSAILTVNPAAIPLAWGNSIMRTVSSFTPDA